MSPAELAERKASAAPPRRDDRRIRFLDYPLDTFSFEETIDEIHRIVRERRPVQHCVLNAYKIYLLGRDKSFADVLQRCAMVQADGISVVWAGRLLGLPRYPRITGIDLMERLLTEADRRSYRIYFLGATDEVLARAKKIISERFPRIVVSGARNGYFEEAEESAIVSDIAASKSDFLFVAMSSPKKEYWLNRHLHELNVPFAMGVGGSVDVLAGKTRRAPTWVQRFGLEWAYRTVQEPRRLFKRYCACISYFGWAVGRQLVRKMFGRSERPSEPDVR